MPYAPSGGAAIPLHPQGDGVSRRFQSNCHQTLIFPSKKEVFMTITRVPDVVFKTRVRDESVPGPNPYRWQDQTTQEIFGGKKVVLFALPGAFTPTCSSTHLPRYEELYDEFKALGVDQIICLSVNDAFVMFQWGKQQGAKNVFLLPDGSGEFTRKMGMLVDKSNIGFGMRSWRYAMVVNDGNIEKMFVEPGFEDNCPTDPFEVSDADTVLAYLKGVERSKEVAPRLSFVG
jgi:peroxiredoxin